MMRERPRDVLGAIIVASLVLSAPIARADGADSENELAAAALVEAGAKLQSEKRYDAACPKFREAAQIAKPGLGALIRLAECYEQAGRTASAWNTWHEVEAGARMAGQVERAATARERVTKLDSLLARLTIEISEPARSTAGMEIRRDNVAIGEPQWGVPVPVDPGRHVVRVTAPRKKPWEVAMDVGGAGRVTVTVPALEALPTAGVDGADPGKTRRIAGITVAASSAATLAVAIGLQVKAVHDLAACPDLTNCTGPSAETYEGGRREQWATNALYAITGAALVGGVVLYLTAPTVPAAKPANRATSWTVAATAGGIGLDATW